MTRLPWRAFFFSHYIAPPLDIAWWAATSHDDRIGFRDLPYMVAPSIGYMSYVLLLGHLTGTYPYAMLDDTFRDSSV